MPTPRRHLLLQSTLDYLAREYRVVTRAPASFGVAVLLAAALISWAFIWSFRGETNLLRQQLSEYRDKLHGASADEAKTALDALTDEVNALQAQLKPRRVNARQRQILTERSQVPSGTQYAMTIVYEGACWDCPQYAADLDDAFRSIPGWSVSHRVLMGLTQRPPQGLALLVADTNRPSPQEQLLLQALQAAGIEFELQAARSKREPGPQLLLAARAAQ
ncbi:MAG TPA: hypothetical protein VGH39_11325 [Xanthobacteraceae bacterium]|jgi:hypothetical protein